VKTSAIDRLCDLASSALGSYHGKGSSTAVGQVHSEIMGAIRELGRGEISDKTAASLVKKLQAKLWKATK
jgi:hypothetical protein